MIVDDNGAATPVDEILSILSSLRSGGGSMRQLMLRWRDVAERIPMSWAVDAASDELTSEVASTGATGRIAYHAECLSTLDWTDEGDRCVRAKVIGHLALLGHELTGRSDKRFLPKISIVAPVDETVEPETIERGLRSCVNQTLPVEIIAVGTARSLESIEAPCDENNQSEMCSIRAIPVESTDPAAMLNAGRAAATGDFVQVFEADDVLEPNAISNQVNALIDEPDARLAVGELEGAESAAHHYGVADLFSLPAVGLPLRDPLLAATGAAPFEPSAVMAPRWFLEQIGDAEVGFGRAGFARYVFEIASSGAKIVYSSKTIARRPQRRLLAPEARNRNELLALEADLQTARELSESPATYRYLPLVLDRMTVRIGLALQLGMAVERLEAAMNGIEQIEARLGEEAARGAGLAALLCDQLLFAVRQRRRLMKSPPSVIKEFLERREWELRNQIKGVDQVSAIDLRRWLPRSAQRPYIQLDAYERTALLFALTQLQTSVFLGELPIHFQSLVRLGACFPGHPYETPWLRLVRLARVVGEDMARRICRQTFIHHGWTWLGQLRKALIPSPAASAA